MNFHHSSRCPAPHDNCACGANDAMALWADRQNARAADQIENAMLVWADRQAEQAADQIDKDTYSWH